MNFIPLSLKGAYVIEPRLLEDERGSFARVFCRKKFSEYGLNGDFVQINHSWNTQSGTLRGMHYQLPPFRENKFIRCISGSVFDVIIDLRKDSSTFLQHEAMILSAANRHCLYIPEGFAHGFLSLENNTQLLYHHTEYYKPDAESALRFDDPALGIKWPFPPKIISERDRAHKLIETTFKGI